MGSKKRPENVVVVEGLRKSFRLPHEQHNGLKQLLLGLAKKGMKKGYEDQEVLRGVSFSIKEGDFFGIVGRNGSGKSTLLKTLAGIYAPNEGTVDIKGSLVPFIELGVGFNPELTGRENVFLNGALLGFSHEEMKAMYDDIVEFAEIERFMDQKLKNYSSGMQVRLAFSIAIRANADILLLDEVLAVGDEAFQRKCFSYFAELKRKKKTVILVTHDMNSVQRFCNKAILIDNGKILMQGNPAKVAQKYQDLNRVGGQEKIKEVKRKKENRINVTLTGLGAGGVLADVPKTLNFQVVIKPDKDISNAFFGFTIRKESGELVFWRTTELPPYDIDTFKKDTPTKLSVTIQNIFGEGKYLVGLSVKSTDRSIEYIVKDDALSFSIGNRGMNGWALHPEIIIEEVR